MPRIIEHIDAIARKKKRDVLFVEFREQESEAGGRRYPMRARWPTHAARKRIIAWLDGQQIGWQPCGPIANPNVLSSYDGAIYIDIPYDRDDAQYQRIEAYLENPDGSSRLPGARFCYTTYEGAMRNCEHDEPGYWDRIAEQW